MKRCCLFRRCRSRKKGEAGEKFLKTEASPKRQRNQSSKHWVQPLPSTERQRQTWPSRWLLTFRPLLAQSEQENEPTGNLRVRPSQKSLIPSLQITETRGSLERGTWTRQGGFFREKWVQLRKHISWPVVSASMSDVPQRQAWAHDPNQARLRARPATGAILARPVGKRTRHPSSSKSFDRGHPLLDLVSWAQGELNIPGQNVDPVPDTSVSPPFPPQPHSDSRQQNFKPGTSSKDGQSDRECEKQKINKMIFSLTKTHTENTKIKSAPPTL